MVLAVSGCRDVSYPKETLAQSVVEATKNEYGIDVKASVVGRTLCVAMDFKKLWGDDGFVEKTVWEDVGKVKFVVCRILFSSDAEIDFFRYIITADDSKEELHYVRAVLDEKLIRYQAIAIDAYQPPSGVISAEEYWAREVLVRRDAHEGEPVFEEVRWGDFIAEQISARIKNRYQTFVTENPRLDLIDNFFGLYIPKEDEVNKVGQHIFALVIQSKEDPKAITFLEGITQDTVEKVCKVYQRFPFERLRILNMDTHTIFEIPV